MGTTYTQNDFNTWRANFGATLGSGAGAGGSDHAISPIVPEPATVLLLVFGAAVCACQFANSAPSSNKQTSWYARRYVTCAAAKCAVNLTIFGYR
jgi:hypothetical protein